MKETLPGEISGFALGREVALQQGDPPRRGMTTVCSCGMERSSIDFIHSICILEGFRAVTHEGSTHSSSAAGLSNLSPHGRAWGSCKFFVVLLVHLVLLEAGV